VGSSIKPPGAGSPDAVDGADAADAAEAVESAEALGAAGETEGASAEVAGAGGAATAAPDAGTGAWLAKLDAGQISQQEAVDGIVAEALEAHGGDQLEPARRSELESVLREALQDDPVLGGWLNGQ
jgi:hypothetical protein